MVISRTPFRISFFGGGTDYPAWYRQHGGMVLATTINRYCYLTCRFLPPFFDHKYRVVYSRAENCQTIDEIVHPAVREVLRYLNFEHGLEIHHDADLPARSGLGSSSAFTVGLLHALHALKGQIFSPAQLAREAIYIEQDRLKETVGCQDQVLAAHGGLNQIEFLPHDEIRVTPLTLPAERVVELSDHLMLFFTGINRTASTIAQSYVQDLHRKEQQLQRMIEMVKDAIAILNSGEDIARLGQLLHEAWRAKRSLSDKVSNSAIEEIYEQAMAAGALGGKVTGAGGGGFMVLFVHPPDQPKVKERLRRLIHVPFRFDFGGSRIIFFDPEEDFSEQWRLRNAQPIEQFQEASHEYS